MWNVISVIVVERSKSRSIEISSKTKSTINQVEELKFEIFCSKRRENFDMIIIRDVCLYTGHWPTPLANTLTAWPMSGVLQ